MFPKAPNLNELGAYSVNRPGSSEVVYQPLYDYQVYAAAGQTSLTFFQTPIGGAKTIADTNMQVGGVLPAPQRFLLLAIEVAFFPGNNPGTFGAQAAANNINDVNAVAKSGHVQLFIGNKPYLDEAPIGVMPQSFRLAGISALADQTTIAAASQSRIDYAVMAGPLYRLPTPLLIPTQQNFRITMDWPVAVALPSTVAGRIGVRMLGYLYRSSQ